MKIERKMNQEAKRCFRKLRALLTMVLLTSMLVDIPMAAFAQPTASTIEAAEDTDFFDVDLDEEGEDWEDVDPEAYFMQYEPFAPYYDVPLERMTDAEIAARAETSLNASYIEIATWQDLRGFLNGTLGNNDDHFRLTADIAVTTGIGTGAGSANVQTGQFLTTGRPGVFTGVFDGGGHTITGLRLRASRTTGNTTPSGIIGDQPNVAVGFVQQAGDGAVIRNVNFMNDGTEPTTAAAHFTAANPRHVGIVVGATHGPNAVVTLDNVNLLSAGANATTNAQRMQMNQASNAHSAGSWGGLVGSVANGTTLNIRDTSVERLEVFASNGGGGGTIQAAGGLVGSVNGGRLNVTTDQNTTNLVNVDMRGQSRGASGEAATGIGLSSGPNLAGGVLGFAFSGHAAIYDTTVTSTRANVATGNGHLADPIRGRLQVGGIAGGLNAQATLSLNNVENQAMVQVQHSGGDNTANGRVGGLVGRTAGTLHITDSRNYGVVQHQGNRGAMGGLVGYAGTSARVVITGSHNGTPNGAARPGQLFPAGAQSGSILHRNSTGNQATAADNTNNGSAAAMGGIIGRSRGSLIIEDTVNNGHVNKANVGSSAVARNHTRIGGIVGRVHPVGGQVVTLNNVTNNGQVTIGASAGSAGGIMGEILNPPRGSARITLENIENHGLVTGGRETGGIIAWSRPRHITLRNVTNTANIARATSGRGTPQDAGGIVGRVGGADFRIEGAQNTGNVMPTVARPATNTGGIIGRSTGARLVVNEVRNEGHVRGFENTAGIVGFANGNNATVNAAVNEGNINTTRSGGRATAAGIVGRGARRHLLIRNTGNFGNVTMVGTNNNTDGVAGVLGRSHGANARVEVSFNQGSIGGRNSAGGIVGRNQGTLQITDVYNIGPVTGGSANSARSGNGILGRRRTGRVQINRAWVSAQVGGYAVATSQAGTGQQNANGAITGITFSNVFVDETTFNSNGTGITATNPAIQSNRNGIFSVDTELLTNDILPGFSGGPWRTGIEGVDLEDQTTYPYFAWQTGGGLQAPFFSFIRAERTEDDENRWRSVMDLPFEDANNPIRFLFRECNDADEHPLACPAYTPIPHTGTQVFNTYTGFTPVDNNATEHQITLNGRGGNETSIGLISEHGVVGFETREVRGRIIIRGYDPLFGEDPNYYINHARFEIVSADASEVDLNSQFFEDGVDTMRGMGLIRFDVDDDNPGEIISGLNPKAGNPASNPSDPTATDLADYTVVRITALGYRPAYRIIYTGDLDELSRGLISVPMERVPFEIRVWVPQEPQTDDEFEHEEYEPGPPGTAATNPTPEGARQGFGALPGHTPGSHLALEPSLTHTSHNDQAGAAFTPGDTFESGNAYPSGHFQVQTVMWGDQLEATATLHNTNTLTELRFEHLIDRDASPIETAEDERILDLDLYVAYIGLPEMAVRFVEHMGYTEDGEPILRPLNLTGDGLGANPMPNLNLTVDNTPDPAVVSVAHPPAAGLMVHQPREAAAGTGAAVGNATQQDINFMAGNFQHFRVTGMSENATFSVEDTTGTFLPVDDLPVSDFFEWFYPLVNEEGALLQLTGNQANREGQIEDAAEGDPILVRTLVVPLRRVRDEEVRVVQRVAEGIYLPIYHSTLTHNDHPPHSIDGPGIFTIRDEGFNLLEGSATGFISREVNAYNGTPENSILDELLAGTNGEYVRIVLDRTLERTPGYLEGFVWNHVSGVPIEGATILVFDGHGNVVYSRAAITDEVGFYQIPYAAIEAGILSQIQADVVAALDPDSFASIVDFLEAVTRAVALEVASRGDLLAEPVRVMATHPGFAPNWSLHNPVMLDPGGAIADVLLTPDEAEYLLMVSVVDEDGSEVAVDEIEIDGVTLVRHPSGYWRISGDAAFVGDLVVTPTGDQTGYVFIPGLILEVTDADYTSGVASIVIRRIGARTVTFDLEGGEPGAIGDVDRFDPQMVSFGGQVVDPAVNPGPEPVHPNGYEFSHWAVRVEVEQDEEVDIEALNASDMADRFIPWNFDHPVLNDMTLHAQWIVTVTFDANGGTLIDPTDDVREVLRGEVVGEDEMPENPTRIGYRFVGWFTTSDQAAGTEFTSTTVVTTNVTVYARWAAQEDVNYTFDWNVTDVADVTGTVVYGGTPVAPVDVPLNPGYRFMGWNPVVGPITEDTTFVAQWSPQESVNYTFDWDIEGVANITGTVPYNGTPVAPSEVPVNPGYRFTGWSPEVGPITEDTTFVAQWSSQEDVNYTFDWDIEGVANVTGTVPYNGTPVAPSEVPVNPGYRFTGWSPEVGPITEDTTFVAQWSSQNDVAYKFNWNVSGVVNVTGTVPYNGTPVAPSEVPVNPGYRFDGWSPVVGPIMEDTTFDAIWEPIYVNYTFDWGLTEVANPTGEVRYNTAPMKPATIPENPGYVFSGWEPIVGPITEDTTFVARWIEEVIPPVYVDYTFDWNVVGVPDVTGQVIYDTTPIPPTQVPSNPGYTFVGWSPEVGRVTEDTTFVAQWDPVYVTYTFNWRVTGVPSVTGTTRYNTAPGEPATTPENPGYTFVGWSPEVGRVTEDAVFDAIWIANDNVRVDFDANGGTPDAYRFVQGGLTVGSEMPEEPTRAGYEFIGWFTEPSGGTEFTQSTSVTEHVTVYARWTANDDVRIDFDANGGTPDAYRYVQGGLTVGGEMPEDPTRAGYQFVGWFTEASDGTEFTSSTPVSENTTVYARWISNADVTVTFHPNNGEIPGYAGNALRSVQGGLFVGPNMPADPTRAGYEFVGWYTELEGGTRFTGLTLVPEDITVYARWIANDDVRVDFDANGGTPDAYRYVQGGLTVGTAMPTDPTRIGYQFAGWYTELEGGTAFTSETPVPESITVYARWTANANVRVTFDGNGGTPTTQHRDVQGGLMIGLNMPEHPTRAGYVFEGWYTEREGGTEFTLITLVPESITVYARWTANADVRVTFDGNGGTPTTQYRDVQGGLTVGTAMPADPTREGYLFVGWYTEIEGGTEFTSATVITETMTVYARWTTNEAVRVDFNANGGTPDAHRYVQGGLIVGPNMPTDPTKTGYTFAGWYTAAEGGIEFTSATPVIEAITVYARWTANDDVRVTFDGNGGTPTTQYRDVQGGLTVGAAMPADPTRTGYVFAGWFTETSGGTEFTLTTPVNEDITVYARWTANANVRVIFDGNGGTPTTQYRDVQSGLTVGTAMPADPTRTGYVFAGWYTATEGGTAFTSTTVVTENMTVYARWTTTERNLAINNVPAISAPTGQTSSGTRIPGDEMTIVAGESTNYIFLGWIRGTNAPTSGNINDVPGVIRTPSHTFTMPNTDVTYNALWGNEDGNIGVPRFVYVNYTFDWNVEDAPDVTGHVRQNTAPIAPTTVPSNPGYVFSGWDPIVGPITVDTVFVARWIPEEIPPVYVDYTFNWNVASVPTVTGQVIYNTTPTAPTTIPANPGYHFAGWSPAVGPITEATVFVARWEPIYVNYTFNWGVEGVLNVNGAVRYNTSPTAPVTVPNNPGYTFVGWSPVVGPITADAVFVAEWEREEEPTSPSEPTEPTDLTEPSTPSEPTEPTGPNIPTDPSVNDTNIGSEPIPDTGNGTGGNGYRFLPQTGVIVGSSMLGGLALATGLAFAAKKKKKSN